MVQLKNNNRSSINQAPISAEIMTDDDRANLLKLKEFCRVTSLSRKALLIYEEKGLLSPEQIDPDTGYRYYGEEQIRRAMVLAFLKNFELSISDMKAIVDGEMSFRQFLLKAPVRRGLVDRHIKATHALTAAKLCEEDERFLSQDVITRVLPQRPVFSISGRGAAAEVSMHVSLLARFAARLSIPGAGPLFTVYSGETSPPSSLRFKVCYPVSGYWNIDHADIVWEELPSRRVAVLRHFGGYEMLPVSYRRLDAACAARGWTPTGEYIETYVIAGDVRSTDASSFITDIAAVLQ